MAHKAGKLFQRKLQALEYHSPGNINIKQPQDLKALIVWLEDQKIRHWKISERTALRSNTGNNWKATFKTYLKELECPYNSETNLDATVDWLLGVAVRYEFNEAAKKHPHICQGLGSAQSSNVSSKVQQAAGKTSALNIDSNNVAFIQGVETLAKILKITRHPDPTVLLAACRLVIEEKLADEVVKEATEQKSQSSKKDLKQFKISPRECGFDIGDPVLAEAAKVLRLLHLQELRYLQTNINKMIVTLQAITADPKTDQSLGKVGK